MTDNQDSGTPPQDTGLPDAVETDGAALSSAEDLDEDRLRLIPLKLGWIRLSGGPPLTSMGRHRTSKAIRGR
jgi:hypothetical protein